MVITEDQAVRLLSEANPVLDASELDLDGALPTTRLAEYEARSKGMTNRIDKSNTTRRSRRIFIGVFATVAFVVLGMFLLPRTPNEASVAGAPTTLKQTPVETAEDFLEAYYGRFDVDQAFTYLGAEPEAVGLGTAGAPNYHLLARFFEATGSKLVDLQCQEASTSPEGAVVTCTWSTHDFFSDELGLGPFGPNADELIIVDGKIVSIVDGTDEGPNEFSNQIWEPFADWIAEKHPDDRAVMYDPYPNGWRITEESIPVWEQRLREYVGEVTSALPMAEDITRGVEALPPAEATPSLPEDGELVAAMWSHVSAAPAFGDAWLWVYADGRMIWSRSSAETGSTGFVEQRLTPEGVDMVGAEIISTGLFDPDKPPPDSELGGGGFPAGEIKVRNGDRLVSLARRPGVEWATEFDRLHGRLRELMQPQSWLPLTAWEDHEIRPYVPSRYAVCMYSGEMKPQPTEPSPILMLLPEAAGEFLVGHEHWTPETQLYADTVTSKWVEHCFDLTVNQAREFAEAIDGAGIEPVDRNDVLWYEFPGPDAPLPTVDIVFSPYLPHGEQECACGG